MERILPGNPTGQSLNSRGKTCNNSTLFQFSNNQEYDMPSRPRLFLSFTIFMIASLLLASCRSTSAPTPDVVASDAAATGVPATTAPAVDSAANSNTDSDKSITIVIAEDPPSFNPIVADTGFDALVMELVMLGMT